MRALAQRAESRELNYYLLLRAGPRARAPLVRRWCYPGTACGQRPPDSGGGTRPCSSMQDDLPLPLAARGWKLTLRLCSNPAGQQQHDQDDHKNPNHADAAMAEAIAVAAEPAAEST